MTNEGGANAKRLAAVALAVALAAVLATAMGQATTRSASAQTTTSPLAISKSVHPNPANAILVGTHMDFLITEYNNSRHRQHNVTVTDTLPGGVQFVAANASQGQCNPMADQPTAAGTQPTTSAAATTTTGGAQLADTGGPSLMIPAAALLLGSGVLGLLAAARLARRSGS